GEHCFENCRSIKKVYLNKSITEIPDYAFYGCQTMYFFGGIDNVKDSGLNIESWQVSIGNYAFGDCDAFTTIYVPGTVTSLGNYAFTECDSVLDATLDTGNSITKLPNGLFAECPKLVTVLMPDYITSVGDNAFKNDILFKNLINDEEETGLQLTNIISVGANAFYMCESVDEINFAEVQTLGSYSFYGMENFSEIVIPDTVTRFDEGVFGGWTNLVDFTVPFVGQTNGRGNDGVEGVIGWMFGRTQDSRRSIVGIDQYYDHSNHHTRFYVPAIETLTLTVATTLPGCALYRLASMITLNLPDTLKTVYQHAIAYCTGLTVVTIPDSVNTIESHALTGCSNLEEVFVPFVGRNRTGGNGFTAQFGYIFNNEDSDGTMTSRGMYYGTAYMPKRLTKVHITTPTYIRWIAFYHLNMIKELYIGDTLTEVAEEGLRELGGLEKLVMPFVGTKRSSTGLQGTLGAMFGYSNSDTYVTQRTVQYYNATQSISAFIPKTLTTIEITDATQLTYGSLMNLTTLEHVTLNDNEAPKNILLDIYDRAFEGCTGLKELVIPTTVTRIMAKVLDKCSSLESLTVPFVGQLKSDHTGETNEFGRWFGLTTFAGATEVEGKFGTYYIPSGLAYVEITNAEYLNDYAFYQCEFVKQVVISSPVITTIGNSTFFGCTSLTSFVIPETVDTLNVSIFENCTSLTEVTYFDLVTEIGDRMFANCTSLKKFEFRDNVLSIGESAFEGCTSLGIESAFDPEPTNYLPTIELNNVESIGETAFKDCTSLVTITFHECLESIGDYAFEGCSSLTTLVHENTVLGVGVFKDCTSLDNVTLNEGTTLINDEAFLNCSSLSNIIVASTVTAIGDRSFQDCISLSEIELPEGLLSIGENAFKNSGLTYIIIPSTVIEIGDYAFVESVKLKKAIINNSILGLGMFMDCTDLRNAYIAIGVSVIPKEAFKNCEKLTLVTTTTNANYAAFIKADASYAVDVLMETSSDTTDIMESAFENCTSLDNVDFKYILETGKKAFYNAGLTHVEIPSTILTIGESIFASNKKLLSADVKKDELSVRMFMDCPLLDNMIVIEGTQVIPEQAFKNCVGLENLTLPYSLTTFEDEVFINTGIPSIIINPDVSKVGKRVFAECLNLETVYNYPNFLGEGMFEGSTNLKHVYLYKDMGEIAN
ncbi:MAG: leucine-rich repeat domain-containing protein, partial [Anaeroplasmataceae bacterium]|nr:leucine-rich repeat domain-containing protein [Anaeroplasmataceae bacterium]